MLNAMTNQLCAWWEVKKQEMKEFWKEEAGGGEIIAAVLIIAVVLVLAVMFFDRIKAFLTELMDNIFKDPGIKQGSQ